MEVKLKSVYRHFKGNYYLVEDIALDSETLEKLVIYRALYDNYQLYVRPYEMFLEKLDKNKYPNIDQEYRFQLQKTKK